MDSMQPASAVLDSIDDSDHDNDLSIAQYARKHRLSRHYLSKHPLSANSIGHVTHDTLNFDDTHELPQLIHARTLPTDEKWPITSGCAAYLHGIMRPPELLSDHPLDRNVHAAKRHKVELPLLLADPDVELNQFLRRAKRHNLPDYLKRAQDITDGTIDDHLSWPLEVSQVAQTLERCIESEKLPVPTAAAQYLRSITSISSEHEAMVPVRLRLPTSANSITAATVTPPLLPCSSPYLQAYSPPDLGDPLLTSTPEDPSAKELAELEEQLFAEDYVDFIVQDTETAARATESCIHFPSEATGMSGPDRKRRRPADFKIESPLLMLDTISSPCKRTKLVEQALEHITARLPTSPTLVSAATDDEDYERFFDDIVDLAAPAELALATERLQEADSTMRIRVPEVSALRPLVPWSVYDSTSHRIRRPNAANQRRFLEDLLRAWPKKDQSWKITGQDQFSWKPLPAGYHWRDTDEDVVMDCGDHVARYISDAVDKLQIDDDMLVWRPDRIKILEYTQDDDDEQNVTSTYVIVSASAAVQTHNEPDSWLAQSLVQGSVPGNMRNLAASEPRVFTHAQVAPSTDRVDGSALFSATSALETFMRVQAGRK